MPRDVHDPHHSVAHLQRETDDRTFPIRWRIFIDRVIPHILDDDRFSGPDDRIGQAVFARLGDGFVAIAVGIEGGSEFELPIDVKEDMDRARIAHQVHGLPNDSVQDGWQVQDGGKVDAQRPQGVQFVSLLFEQGKHGV